MTGRMVRRREARVARADLDGWVATYRDRVPDRVKKADGFPNVAFRTERGGDPCRVTVLMNRDDTDFIQPFLTDAGTRATFQDEILPEANQ